jgi:hypothetical protein
VGTFSGHFPFAFSLLPFTFFFIATPILQAVETTGALAGVVRFPGETPPPYMFANRSDHDCPHGIGANHLLVQQLSLALQNAVVMVDFKGDIQTRPGRAVLAAKGCVLQPRIQTTVAPASLHLQAKDVAQHHLHAYRGVATVFELDLPTNGSAVRRPLVDPGFVRIDCDRHLWERAWVYVSAHPYVAVTGADGRFLIKDLPPGRYQVRVWHEGWIDQEPDASGRLQYPPMGQTREAVIRKGRTTEVVFDALERLSEKE